MCTRIGEKQARLERLYADWTKFNAAHAQAEQFRASISEFVRKFDADASRIPYKSLETVEAELEGLRTQMNDHLPQLDQINDFYCELAREYRLDSGDDLKTKFVNINNGWEATLAEIEAMLKRIRHSR